MSNIYTKIPAISLLAFGCGIGICHVDFSFFQFNNGNRNPIAGRYEH